MYLPKNSLNKLSIFLLICIIASCKKDKPDPGCKEYGSAISVYGWQELYESPYVAQPDFNPDNANEFLFVYYPQGGSNRLYKYNIVTKELNLIFTGTNMVYRSRYGRNGWILLNLSGGNIWKIKDNGDSLTQLTFTGNAFHPHWNYNYSRIGYGTFKGGYVINTHDNSVDSFPDRHTFYETSDWRSPRYVCTVLFGIFLYKYQENKFSTFLDFSNNGKGNGYGIAILNDDNTLVWSNQDGIFISNIEKNRTDNIYPSCNSRRFYDASYAPNTNKLLWQRLDYRPVEDSSILYIKSSIVIMNTDGTGEEKIEMPLP